MGNIIDRALDIINDHLKDQTSSFRVGSPLGMGQQAMARGGHVLEDDYPSQYMPGVGRQVMADGGMPENPVASAMQTARRVVEEPQPIPPVNPAALTGRGFEGRVQSPRLESSFAKENLPGVVVSPRPGKGSGPRVMPEHGVPYEQPEYEGYGAHGEEPTSDIEFSPSTPAVAGTALPPPVQHPLQNEPRLQRITENTHRILKSPGFRKLVEDHVGLKGPLQITPTHGTWRGEAEPSFILNHPDMQTEHAEKLAHLLGFGFQQDAVVHNMHNPDLEEGAPAILMGHGKKLNTQDIDKISGAAKNHGLDFTVTQDGKAAKFVYFGAPEKLDDFYRSVVDVSESAGLKDLYHARTKGDLIYAKNYLNGIFGEAGGETRDQAGPERSPDLFGRIVDHVLAPYAKAVAGEGYRLSPERLAETFGLTQDEQDKVRDSLYPKSKGDRTTVPLMNGDEELDVRPTGDQGKATVRDALYALQNRAAEKGQIDPGDFSDKAKKSIANDVAGEVKYHVDNSEKSAVGWYDVALKKAKDLYHTIYPELKTDRDKGMLFDALLGIASQGNDVYANSVFAARMYDKIRNQGKSIPEAVKDLSGGFGAQTKAIEGNFMKLHHLLDQNGYDHMRDLFNQTKTVSEWNKILRTSNSLRVPGQGPLKMQGAADQKVTGWMVFGPKIGSFINNLHGDYSTLTADLWFSRTWNRLLGHNFIHTPLAEQKQYQDFKDAIRAEFLHHNGLPHEQYAGKTNLGQYERDEKGNITPWEFGDDMKNMSHDDFNELINNPERMQELASSLYEQYKDGHYKDKSDARRRAKNWMENRDLAVAAPRGDKEREFQQSTIEEAQKILKKNHGIDISVADIQAALWFHEKELFHKLGVASERAQPADYADAAAKTIELINSGDLYRIKSKEKNPKKPKKAKAYGGAINPIELRDDPEDMARRLILWSYAVAPVVRPLSRAEGGPVDDPVDKALSVAGASQPNAAQKAVETARSLTPMGFYSAAAEAASKIPQRAPIDQIINKVKGSPGVKAEELDQSGVRDAFAGQKSVDPKEVARHFQENLPQINEKVYGGAPIVHQAEPVDPEYFFGDDVPRGITDTYVVGPRFKPEKHYQIHEYGPTHRDDFSEYYLKGPRGDDLGSYESLDSAVEAANAAIAGREPARWKEYNGQMLVLPGGKNYREVVMHMPKGAGSNEPPFKSTHWKEDNVLAHLRMHDRTDGLSPEQAQDIYQRIAEANKVGNVRHLGSGAPSVAVQKGVVSPEEAAAFARHKGWTGSEYFDKPGIDNKNKILHIEEIQSDWAQKGRDEGFQPPQHEIDRATREIGGLNRIANSLRYQRMNAKTDEEKQAITDQLEELQKTKIDPLHRILERTPDAESDYHPLPHGPYVTDTNSWTDLALKRALKEAAEGGYDKLIWTPGEQQAERYNLSHQVREVAYNPQTKRLIAMTHNGEDFGPNGPVEPKDIGKHIGKAAAKKLLEQTPNNLGMHSLRGDDLKVGGHGMIEYYDRIVPSRLQALVKKLDPEAKINLFSHDLPAADGEGTIKGHALHLTPKLREAILKGLPAYEHGGSVDRTKMHYKDVTKRIPQLTEAAASGVGGSEYQNLVNIHKPVQVWNHVPPPASFEEMHNALEPRKREKLGRDADIPEGHPVGLRLDIPAYRDHGVWIPTIHDRSGGSNTVLAHAPHARVSNATFNIPQKKAEAVAKGGPKSPFATIDGSWKPTSVDDAQSMAETCLNHPDWRQVGMDPERHSYFYDRETQEPVTHAEEVLQVGPLVLAKNPRYGNREDYSYERGGSIIDHAFKVVSRYS